MSATLSTYFYRSGYNGAKATPAPIAAASIDPTSHPYRFIATGGDRMAFNGSQSLPSLGRFTAEVVVVVLGVLIALVAQQWADGVNWKTQVAQAKRNMDGELSEGLLSAKERIQVSKCIDRALDRLDAMIDGAGAQPVVMNNSPPARIRLWGSATWEAATASQAVAHMNADDRSQYAQLFEFLRNLDDWNQQEFAFGSSLRTLERPRVLTDVSRDRLSATIAHLRSLNSLMTLASEQYIDAAAGRHLQIDPADLAEISKPQACPMPDDAPAAHQ